MTEREEAYLLRGKIQIYDAYLGGELPGGKAGLGSENKIPIHARINTLYGLVISISMAGGRIAKLGPSEC